MQPLIQGAERMRIRGYVILNFGEYYCFAPTKEQALRTITGTFANQTDFKIIPATLNLKESV